MSISPHFNPFNKILARDVRIMDSVTSHLPRHPCNSRLSHLVNLPLADETWHTPAEVDMLIGATLSYGILNGDKRYGNPGEPFALSSDLGWLVVGDISWPTISNLSHHSIGPNLQEIEVQERVKIADANLDQQLRRFWELESTGSSTPHPLTREERQCEDHFQATTTQQDDGRFVVTLPFRTTPPDLGSSRDMAIQRLKQMERRLARQPEQKKEYVNFMAEYVNLGHMEEIPPDQIPLPNSYYIPHHFVTKESSTTTKFRVVFDASAKTTNGKSLNDNLMVGAQIQDSLFDILLRFRTHKYAFTADVAKMFRQILVAPQDCDYQRIVWRTDPSQPIKDYRLLTVTYGTAPAPHLAKMSLQQLARNEKETLPLASRSALNDFYMDDDMSGADTVPEALELQRQTLCLVAKAQWKVCKFSSNCPELINALPMELRETKSLFPVEFSQTVKTLGIFWQPESDHFLFKLDHDATPFKGSLTKRAILSEIAKIFDPIGWLAPVVIPAKITMQLLWKLKSGWDEPVPAQLHHQWTQHRSDLKHIESLQIPRCVKPTTNCKIALVGFCDASEKAYAAVVYLCIYPEDSSPPLVSILATKTRVAPTRTVSLPRLELCGAVLLSHLMETVQQALQLPLHHISAWTDSMVTLAWIQQHPSKWNRFVANRVTEIQDRVPSNQWGHVPGVDNPADCASRGLDPSTFIHFSLWWNGPTFLRNGVPTLALPHLVIDPTIDQEERREVVCHKIQNHPWNNLLQECSSLASLTRITAWILRFATNAKIPLSHKQERNKSHLTSTELNNALIFWVKIVQQQFRDTSTTIHPAKIGPQELASSSQPIFG